MSLAVVKRHHSVYGSPADGAPLGLGQGQVAGPAGAHVAALQENAGALPAQAHGAGGRRHRLLVQVQLTHAPPLLLLELPQDAPLLAGAPVLLVAPPQEQEEQGAGSRAERQRQQPPHAHAALLLAQQGLVVQPAEEVGQALLGGLQLHQVVVQHQLPHPGHALAQPQHLLRLADALGPLAADEVADDVGEGLHCGVEVLVHRLQVQLGRVQRAHHAHSGFDRLVVTHQVKGDRVGALVDQLLCVVPVWDVTPVVCDD